MSFQNPRLYCQWSSVSALPRQEFVGDRVLHLSYKVTHLLLLIVLGKGKGWQQDKYCKNKKYNVSIHFF